MHLIRYRSDRFVGYIDPRFDCPDLRDLVSDPYDIGNIDGAIRVATRPGREVYRLEIETSRGPAEVYTHLLKNTNLFETFREPQAFTVLRTGRRMLACGLPTSRVLAAVRPRWVPYNRTSFAVTLAIRDAVPLSTLSADEFRGRLGGFNKLHLIRQIAVQTAWLHSHGFYHKDLIAPNILVARRRAMPMVWFVGLGRTGSVRWMPAALRRRRWANDLLTLMRSEIGAIDDRDRAVFLETYLRALSSERTAEIIREIIRRKLERSLEDRESS